MSDDYEDMPEIDGIMNRVGGMDLASFSVLADMENEDPYNNFPHDEAHREEEVVESIFKDFGAPQDPPPTVPTYLQNHLQNVANLRSALDESRMQYKPGMINMVGESYHLEKLDPRHRVGFILAEILPYWEHSSGRAQGKGFFKWLDEMSYFEVYRMMVCIGDGDSLWATQNTRMLMKGVEYLDAISRRHYQVTLSERRNCMLWNNRPLSTAHLSTVFSGKGWGAWVLSGSDTFYTGPHTKGEFHHSSFLSGGMVKAAGEWKVEAGRLKTITGKTGHYKCPIEHLVEALTVMQKKVGLSGAYVNVWDKVTGKPKEFPAITFLSNKTMQDEYEAWGNETLHTKVVEQRKPLIGTHRIK